MKSIYLCVDAVQDAICYDCFITINAHYDSVRFFITIHYVFSFIITFVQVAHSSSVFDDHLFHIIELNDHMHKQYVKKISVWSKIEYTFCFYTFRLNLIPFFYPFIDQMNNQRISRVNYSTNQHEFLKTLFGLPIAPAFSQRYIDTIFRQFATDEIGIMYMKDLIIRAVNMGDMLHSFE